MYVALMTDGNKVGTVLEDITQMPQREMETKFAVNVDTEEALSKVGVSVGSTDSIWVRGKAC